MRRPLIAVLALFTLGLPGGVTAQEGPQVLTSDNVEFVGTIPVAAAASSIQFASDAPIAYISTFRGLEVWDITNPALPLPLGRAALGGWQNEAMSLGERPNGDRFVLFAQNTAVLTQADAVYGRRVTVVEVTDPRNPVVHGTVTTPTRTHTASCVNKECTFAYTDGRTQGRISVIDLRDFRNPKMASIPELTTPVAQGHDQDVDEAGILWHVGGQGSVAMDVTDPERPRLLNSTTQAGATPPWNRFIHHNSYRPHASAFKHLTEIDPETGEERLLLDEFGNPQSGPPALENGNVLLVTEELTTDPGCPQGDGEGAFQTWHVPFLSAEHYAEWNAGKSISNHRGTIRPLDKWNTELNTGTALKRVPGFCSAHYFDYHQQESILASGWYEQGVRLLDVRDPLDIKQVGWFMVPGMETWAAYWVPEYKDGKQTGADTNLVFSADNTRGVDILRVDLGSLAEPEDTVEVRAPILPQWLVPNPALEARRSDDYGYACRMEEAPGLAFTVR